MLSELLFTLILITFLNYEKSLSLNERIFEIFTIVIPMKTSTLRYNVQFLVEFMNIKPLFHAEHCLVLSH